MFTTKVSFTPKMWSVSGYIRDTHLIWSAFTPGINKQPGYLDFYSHYDWILTGNTLPVFNHFYCNKFMIPYNHKMASATCNCNFLNIRSDTNGEQCKQKATLHKTKRLREFKISRKLTSIDFWVLNPTKTLMSWKKFYKPIMFCWDNLPFSFRSTWICDFQRPK